MLIRGFGKHGSNEAVAAAVAKALDPRFDQIDARLGTVDGRLDTLDGWLGTLDGQLGTLDARLDALDGKWEREFVQVRNEVVGLREAVATLHERFTQLELGFVAQEKDNAAHRRHVREEIGRVARQLHALNGKIARLEGMDSTTVVHGFGGRRDPKP